MNTPHDNRLLRWFLLIWVSLVYVWGSLALIGLNPKVWDAPEVLVHLFPAQLDSNAAAITAFTLPICLYGALLWLGLSEKISQRSYWAYFLVQGGLVLVIGFVVQQENVVLSLYLALTLAAICMLKRVRPVTLVASGSLVLFLVSSLWTIWGQPQPWSIVMAILWFKTDYPALLLFGVGYVVLYVQQTREHAQLEAAHIELASTHAKLEAAHMQLMASAEHIELLTRATERQRLARELHDTLAQGLTGVVMQIQAANSHLTQQRYPLAQEIMQQTMISARQTLSGARSAIDDLRATITSPEEIPEAAEEEIRRFTSTTGIPCTALDLALLAKLPASLGEQALRAISEGLTNVARHAQARQAVVRAIKSENTLVIEVQDDGIGFDLAAVETEGHYGLLGLRERARLVDGEFALVSAPGKGTTMQLRVPAPQEEAVSI